MLVEFYLCFWSNFFSTLILVELFYLHNNQHQILVDNFVRHRILASGSRNPYRKWSNGYISWERVCINHTSLQHLVYQHNRVHPGNPCYHRKCHRAEVWVYSNLSHQNCRGRHRHSTILPCMDCNPSCMGYFHIRYHVEGNLLQIILVLHNKKVQR